MRRIVVHKLTCKLITNPLCHPSYIQSFGVVPLFPATPRDESRVPDLELQFGITKRRRQEMYGYRDV
jgi:hypothetical protein